MPCTPARSWHFSLVPSSLPCNRTGRRLACSGLVTTTCAEGWEARLLHRTGTTCAVGAVAVLQLAAAAASAPPPPPRQPHLPQPLLCRCCACDQCALDPSHCRESGTHATDRCNVATRAKRSMPRHAAAAGVPDGQLQFPYSRPLSRPPWLSGQCAHALSSGALVRSAPEAAGPGLRSCFECEQQQLPCFLPNSSAPHARA